ncbi:MAG: hypothetical protein ACOCQD_01070 [archaeon]
MKKRYFEGFSDIEKCLVNAEELQNSIPDDKDLQHKVIFKGNKDIVKSCTLLKALEEYFEEIGEFQKCYVRTVPMRHRNRVDFYIYLVPTSA